MMNFAIIGTENGNKYSERFTTTETLQEALDYLAKATDIHFAEVIKLDGYEVVHIHGNK